MGVAALEVVVVIYIAVVMVVAAYGSNTERSLIFFSVLTCIHNSVTRKCVDISESSDSLCIGASRELDWEV